MSIPVSAQEVRELTLSKISSRLHAKGLSPEEVPDEFDLLEQGVVDSQALLEIILAVEEHFHLQLDFERIDPGDLTVIGPFCRYIERYSAECLQRAASAQSASDSAGKPEGRTAPDGKTDGTVRWV